MADLGALCVFDGLQHNTTLVNLSLQRNDITATDPDTVRYLFKMLQVNKSLTHLDPSYNQSLNRMIPCIFQGLKQNTTLLHLNLCDTGMTDDSAKCISHALKSNCSLQTLNITCNASLSKEGNCFVLKSLEFNTTLRKLRISIINSETKEAFYRARRDKRLPPIDILW